MLGKISIIAFPNFCQTFWHISGEYLFRYLKINCIHIFNFIVAIYNITQLRNVVILRYNIFWCSINLRTADLSFSRIPQLQRDKTYFLRLPYDNTVKFILHILINKMTDVADFSMLSQHSFKQFVLTTKYTLRKAGLRQTKLNFRSPRKAVL